MPYNTNMNTQYIHSAQFVDVTTYDIRINEQQRKVLQNALSLYISDGPNIEWDIHGCNVACCLHDMLDPEGSTGPLAQDGINSFVL